MQIECDNGCSSQLAMALEAPEPDYVIVRFFHSQFQQITRITSEEVHWVGSRIPIPRFTCDEVQRLIRETLRLVKQEAAPLVRASLPAWIIGDLHGNFHDLLRFITMERTDGEGCFVFLGDYVDRGCFSLEVMLLLMTLKCHHPDGVILIRGNHEFPSINEEYGFKDEIVSRYGSPDLWEQFNELFSWLPLAAILGDELICLHGGIGPHSQHLDHIEQLELPIPESSPDDIVSEIVWSDPTGDCNMFVTSARGRGVLFGRLAVVEFLKGLSLKKLIRAHQCVHHGVHVAGETITVFSSSNYMGQGNRAGFMFVRPDGEIEHRTFQPIDDLPSLETAVFQDAEPVGMEKPERTSSFALSSGRRMPGWRFNFIQPRILKPKKIG